MTDNYNDFLERVSDNERHSPIYETHLMRYLFAKPFAKGKRVLDAACGSGYGSLALSTVAKNTVGIDISADTILSNSINHKSAGLTFDVMSVAELTFPDCSFDLVVSYETIEHISSYETALDEFKRVLAPEGILIISTPNRRQGSLHSRPLNPFHTQEFSYLEFKGILESRFSSVEFWAQTMGPRAHEAYQGTPIKRFLKHLDIFNIHGLLPASLYQTMCRYFGFQVPEDLKSEDFPITQHNVPSAEFLIAVCRK